MKAGLVISFDMDGVLFDTEAVKIQCFFTAVSNVYKPSESVLSEIHHYNVNHRGVPRAAKFRHITTRLIGQSDPEIDVPGFFTDILMGISPRWKRSKRFVLDIRRHGDTPSAMHPPTNRPLSGQAPGS